MAFSGNYKLRPISINFDLYCEADDHAFKRELLTLMISNVEELKEAASKAYALKDPVIFDKCVHKVKATVRLLDDQELTEGIDQLKHNLSGQIHSDNRAHLDFFAELCESFISSLEREVQLLKFP